MNKQCTNSSCRKTFSTLNFGGLCPFCGKIYPQLESARKNSLPVPNVFGAKQNEKKGPFIRLTIRQGGRKNRASRSLDVYLKDALAYGRKGEKIKGIKDLREQAFGKGYSISLRDSKWFFEAVMDHRPCSLWQVTEEENKPASRSASSESQSMYIKITPVLSKDTPKKRREKSKAAGPGYR